MLAERTDRRLPSPEKLYLEVMNARLAAKERTANAARMWERYVGPAFRDNALGTGWYSENHYFEMVQLLPAQIVYSHPKVRVSTTDPEKWASQAMAMQFGLNRWMKDTQYRRHLERVVVDYLFCYGVSYTTLDRLGERDMDDSPMRPQVRRLSPRLFFMDPMAKSKEQARFMGHEETMDRSDLLRLARSRPEDGWNIDLIQRLGEGLHTDAENTAAQRGQDVPERHQVQFWNIWLPEYKIDGSNGVVATLAAYVDKDGKAQRGGWLRELQPYHGHPSGPYTVFGAYTVPDEVYPLGPLTATEGQLEELNLHADGISEAFARSKTVFLYDELDKKFADKFQNAKDGQVLGVAGLDAAKWIEANVGRIDGDRIGYLQMLRDRMDRVSGIHDAQRGNVEGLGTATEVAVADRASAARVGWHALKMEEGVIEELSKVSWLLANSEGIVFPLGQDAVAQMQTMFPGLELPSGITLEFNSASIGDIRGMELEIEPYSMQRTDDALAQRRAMEGLSIISSLAPMIPQTPWIDWKTLIGKIGDSLNWPDFSALLNEEVAREATQQMLQQSGAAAFTPGGKQEPPPRLSGDVQGSQGRRPASRQALSGRATGAQAGMGVRNGKTQAVGA